MAAPTLPDPAFALPSKGGQPITYAELMRQLSCVCTAGAQIKPSVPPSAAINLGDIIADHARLLSALTSAFGIVAVVMKMIACIIDVLCAIPNPFSVIAAMIRLFGTCLPEFILIFPQLAIPAHILCLIKIIIAIVRYILEVIIPLIQDIVQNVQDLIDAITDLNQDAISAVSFKIMQLLQEFINVVGILAALEALIIMIKALLAAGIGPPCAGSGGSCVGCADDQCPPALQNFSLTGTDGVLQIFFGGDGFSFFLRFSSAAKKSDFLEIRNFFPSGIDYSLIDDTAKVPYTLEDKDTSSTFVVRSIDSAGRLDLFQIPNTQLSDGYLSSVAADISTGLPVAVSDSTTQVRFGTDTETFKSSNLNDFLELQETNASNDASLNSGTFKINTIYDAYNVRLTNDPFSLTPGTGPGWDAVATLDATAHSAWRIIPKAPTAGSGKDFSLDINHEELLRHNMIGVGCHPAISAAAQGTQNRFPFLDDLDLPDIPPSLEVDENGSKALQDALACIEDLVPDDIDEDFILDNYATIAADVVAAGLCMTSTLGELQSDLEDYAKQIYPRVFSPENSLLEVDKPVQVVGGNVEVTLTPFDIYGNKLGEDVPAGTIDAKLFTTFGTLSSVTEELDDDGVPTGEYTANLTSADTGVALVSGSVADIFVSDFDDTLDPPDLVKRQLAVRFVKPASKRPDKPEDSGTTEPLGIARPGA